MFIFNLGLLRQKRKALKEVNSDLAFLVKCKKADKAEANIKRLRAELKKEQGKDDKADGMKVQDFALEIARDEDLMRRYNNLLNARDDLGKYIELIADRFVWKRK